MIGKSQVCKMSTHGTLNSAQGGPGDMTCEWMIRLGQMWDWSRHSKAACARAWR